MRWVALVAVGCLFVLASGPVVSASSVQTQRAADGQWDARLTYLYTAPSPSTVLPTYSDLHLTVLDGSKLVLDIPVTSSLLQSSGALDVWPGAQPPHSSVSFHNLEGNSALQLVLVLFTGGAHCCYIDQVYDLSQSPPSKTEADFGDGGAAIQTINGRMLFVGADDSFDYAFTDYADSASPIEVWQYAADHFTDVTRSYPQLVVKDAAFWWKAYLQRANSAQGDDRGILGAWAADEALLGKANQAKATLLNIAFSGRLDRGFGNPKGSTYVRDLWAFLKKHGYLR